MSSDLDSWVSAVSAERNGCRLPLRADAEAGEILDASLALLFPHFAADRRADAAAVRGEVERLEGWVRCFQAGLGHDDPAAARAFTARFPAIQEALSWTPRRRAPPTRRPRTWTR